MVARFACEWLTLAVFSHGVSMADPLPPTRPFYLSFIRWPADLMLEGCVTVQVFAHAHGDWISVMFIGGIPWPEARDGRPFSKNVQDNLNYRPPEWKEADSLHLPADQGTERHRPVLG